MKSSAVIIKFRNRSGVLIIDLSLKFLLGGLVILYDKIWLHSQCCHYKLRNLLHLCLKSNLLHLLHIRISSSYSFSQDLDSVFHSAPVLQIHFWKVFPLVPIFEHSWKSFILSQFSVVSCNIKYIWKFPFFFIFELAHDKTSVSKTCWFLGFLDIQMNNFVHNFVKRGASTIYILYLFHSLALIYFFTLTNKRC